ncbi:hypothetical protein GOP47_0021577 [Adiantum capillus-veneris]|uniref:TITAN-like protein n=1 Tax=Adiantum capillus-veneris TaxID=13818 RepID=A0A9D4U8E4_ADICA|nr:hypothetical protein GOP47_0021577 [Adiantum capillus-veneris]
MPNKQFEHCKVCRLSHNRGKAHKYSSSHKQRLDSHLSKSLLKIRDLSFFLSSPTVLRPSDRPLNSFWCSFCGTTITELDSTFACSNTLRHLASASHLDAVEKFWHENGAEAEKRHLYGITSEELAKWEDACKALSAASTSMELSHGAVNNIPSACSSSVATCFDTLSVACCMNSHTSDPLPLYKDGNSCYNTIDKRNAVKYGPNISDTVFAPKFNGATSMMCSSNLEQHSGRTCIRLPSGPGDGNVHSGAPPPWLQTSESKTDSAAHALPNCGATLSRSKERQLKKSRNPKRVGAAWADKRRAEMGREAAGHSLQRGLQVDKDWLPNFGGVWQSGSRRETRKEFEAERSLSLETSKPDKIKVIQPYVSKRQRLMESVNMEGSR